MTSPRAGLEQANRNGLLPLWIGAKVGNSLGFEPLSIAKKLGACPCPNKVDPVGLHLINQQKVATDMAFTVICPFPFRL